MFNELSRAKIDSTDPVAVVMMIGITGLGMMRSLARRGIQVVGVDSDPQEPGYASRYGVKLVGPSVKKNWNVLHDFMMKLGQQLPSKGVLLAASDDYAKFISTYAETLQAYFHFSIPGGISHEQLTDKQVMHELAEKCGIPVPRTFFPRNTQELRQLKEEIPFPCILKPTYSQRWRQSDAEQVVGYYKAIRVDDFETLLTLYEPLAEIDAQLMVQEMIQGADNLQYEFSSYTDRESEPLGHIVARKERIYPVGVGTACFAVSVQEPEIDALARQLLKGIGYSGLSNVEFKRDPKDGQFKFIELNPRYGQWDSLATQCGMNLPWMAYQDLLGRDLMPLTRYKTNVRFVYLRKDFNAFRWYRAHGQMKLGGWIRSLASGERVYPLFAWDDPKPFLNSASRSITDFLSRRLPFRRSLQHASQQDFSRLSTKPSTE